MDTAESVEGASHRQHKLILYNQLQLPWFSEPEWHQGPVVF